MQQPCFPLDTFSHPKNDLFMLFVGKKEMCTNVSAALYITVLFVCFFFIMRVILVLHFSRATAEGCGAWVGEDERLQRI